MLFIVINVRKISPKSQKQKIYIKDKLVINLSQRGKDGNLSTLIYCCDNLVCSDFQFKKTSEVLVTPQAVDMLNQTITTQEMTHTVNIKGTDVPQLIGNSSAFTISEVRTIPKNITPNFRGRLEVRLKAFLISNVKYS